MAETATASRAVNLDTHTANSPETNGHTANGLDTSPSPEASAAPAAFDTKPADTSKQDSSNSDTADNNNDSKSKRKPPPGGHDSTKLPDASQGYTLRFTFHSASNLAPGDMNTVSSDPFLHATLKVAGDLKRHRKDPDLTHRTPTLRRTLEPRWDDSWVVANLPPSGFTLKCRLYDEDSPDTNDRLGNATIRVSHLFPDWDGFPPPGRTFAAKKRVISKRAYLLKAISDMFQSNTHMTPLVNISIELLGPSDPPHAHVYTVGPTSWIQHYSPMIGRLAGTKVDKDKEKDTNQTNGEQSNQAEASRSGEQPNKNQRYEFQANEMQLAGPIPPSLYHRFVAFRPIISSMFTSTGLRGKILNKALHKQHNRIYNFDSGTDRGQFESCSDEASRKFLEMAQWDRGGRVFTYILTLDAIFRFTETGKEFGIDLLSKHTMHSDVETYIAYSGEFFIRRLERPTGSDDVTPPANKTHPLGEVPGGPPREDPPLDPAYYQLVIDNDSGTYRPDKKCLPDLKAFLERNLPGLGVVTMHWEDETLQKLKYAQHTAKKKEGQVIRGVLNRSMSSISSAESELDDRDAAAAAAAAADNNNANDGSNWDAAKSKREKAWEALEQPATVKDKLKQALH